ncbi:hypothetical protein Tco_0066656 [Tanacetum coccineum]
MIRCSEDSKLKEEALRNRVIMEGMIDDNDESSNNGSHRKEIDNVGGESTIWKSGSVGVLKTQDGSSNTSLLINSTLRERMKLNLEARLMGETLVLNTSLDPFLEDYIELNDLNVPLELRRDQADDLMPIIEEGKVIEEFRARNDARIVSKVFGYPNFAILEDMDSYRDEGMSDVIFGEPFLREVEINAKRFEGMITIDNGNEEVTYQMVRSHPRFKHHTNKQCNKIPPLLKVSKEDMTNGISHSYQKLKSFYKGILNLGPEYVRDTKMEEWLTRGHISVHEIE